MKIINHYAEVHYDHVDNDAEWHDGSEDHNDLDDDYQSNSDEDENDDD